MLFLFAGASTQGTEKLSGSRTLNQIICNVLKSEDTNIHNRNRKDDLRANTLMPDLIDRARCGDQLSLSLVSKKSLQKQEYILPTLQHNYVYKKTIVDPLSTPKRYKLPTTSSLILEKLTPGIERLVPIEDPHSLQKVSPVIKR